MTHSNTATFDAGDARGPAHALIAAAVAALQAVTRHFGRPTAVLDDDVAAVRALADSVRHSDPGFASDLYAAAARHESASDALAAR